MSDNMPEEQYGRQPRRRNPSRPPWLRRAAMAACAVFTWSTLLATPVFATTHQPAHKRVGVRDLTSVEQAKIAGSQSKPQVGGAGDPFPWQAKVHSTSTANGDKSTVIPIVAWTARGGLPVNFSLVHNSESTRNAELGYNWCHSFDLYAAASGVNSLLGSMNVHYGDDRTLNFTQNVDGSYTAPTGIYDTLVQNGDNSLTLTTKEQVKYHYLASTLYCDTITDENGNTITLAYSGGYLSTITDPSGRKITLSYTSGKLTGITDPLNRTWTIAYTSGNLSSVSLPVLSGTTYKINLLYNSNHCITDYQTPRGYHWTYSYNTDNSLAWIKDPALNQTSFAYTSTTCTVTDPNSNQTVFTYDTSGHVT